MTLDIHPALAAFIAVCVVYFVHCCTRRAL